MICSQINITNPDKKFPYAVEYLDEDYFVSGRFTYSIVNDETNEPAIYFFNNDNDYNVLRDYNVWKQNITTQSTQYLPEDLSHNSYTNVSHINLYFPTFSVNVYSPIMQYAVRVMTYINGCKVVLASYIISPKDAIAIPTGPKTIKNKTYYEYVELQFVDPWFITYDDSWRDFRENVCNEPGMINNTGSLLSVELYPVQEQNGKYIVSDLYNGGACSMHLSDDTSEDLCLNLSCNCFERPAELSPVDWHVRFNADLQFNEAYEGDIYTYLQETYGIDTSNVHVEYDLLLKDDDNIYKYANHSFQSGQIEDTFLKSEIVLQSWDEYKIGCNFIASFSVMDQDDNILFMIYSNPIPAIPEIIKFFINTTEEFQNLNNINMNNYIIDAVNKIEQTVVSVNRPDDYKSNILKPIFVRSTKSDNLTIHPLVTESIALNLDKYKQGVDMMYIRIEGQDFPEIGRAGYGVIFKIVGNMLPGTVTEGLYYILDSNKEMITSGKYTYEV